MQRDVFGLTRQDADYFSTRAVDRDSAITLEDVLEQAEATTNMSRDEIKAKIPRMLQCIRTSPIHVGFVCKAQFFNEAGQFWPDAKIRSRQEGRYQRVFTDSKGAIKKPPIYGALNFTMRGHTGWGASSFALKPRTLGHSEIRSRDTGEPGGFGQYATYGHEKQLLPILLDWAGLSTFNKAAEAWTDDERGTLPPSPSLPLEAAVFTAEGALPSNEVAMIFIAEHELQDSEMKASIETSCNDLDIPVIFHNKGEGNIPFQSYPEYVELMDEYGTRAAQLDARVENSSQL